MIQKILAGRLNVSPEGAVRESRRYLLAGPGSTRPDPAQATWLYAQMIRWGQAPLSLQALQEVKAVFRPDVYDAILGHGNPLAARDVLGAFAGPALDADDVAGYLKAFAIGRWPP
jgi:NitT/TauT family transport system ATP-binding protein